MDDRKPTIYDVARLASVSTQTVSRVINEQPHVRAATRARVLQAIAMLRYTPDPSAQQLGSAQRTHRP